MLSCATAMDGSSRTSPRLPDEVSVNEHLLANGFADTLRIGPNKAYVGDYAAARNRARAERIGAWGACPHPFA